MRKIGIIAAVFALAVGTWFFMQKTGNSPASHPETASHEPTTAQDPKATEQTPTQAPTAEVSASKAPEAPQTPESAPVAAVVPSGPAHEKEAAPESAPAVTSAVTATPPAGTRKPKETVSTTLPPVTAAVPSVEKKQEPAKNCYTFEYRHQDSAKSKDIESFLDFSNAFPLAAENVNKKSICVKVNQKPVEFQILKMKGKEEIVIGPVVGPESIIRVSYCTGAAQCRESCTPPKKRFMDDLMSDAHAEDFQESWGKAGADADSKELKAKSKEFQALARTNSGLNDRAMMRDWNTLQKQEWTCNRK
jgi:hypothetical protein